MGEVTGRTRKRVIAIDGPAASGKSTTARRVAERLGFVHLNSGLLYRAITWRALTAGWDPDAADFDARVRGVDITLVADADGLAVVVEGARPGSLLHGRDVSSGVSAVSARASVRDVVLERLRAARERFDLVCDGRDIGTTVFPDAELKVFLVADAEERARRRLADHGECPTDAEVARETARLEARDEADASRELSPLRRAADAVEIDTTERSPREVVDRILALAETRGLGSASAG